MVLAVPASEFAVARPEYRITAYRHTGDWGLPDGSEFNLDVIPPVDEPLLSFE